MATHLVCWHLPSVSLFLTMQAQEGMVVAVGPGRRNLQSGEVMPVSVKEGDKVLLPEYGGQVLKLDDKE